MPAALSDDLRLRIHEAVEAGDTTAEAAERFAVSASSVERLRRRYREAGTLAPKPGGRGPAPALAPRYADLRESVRQCPDATPAEHARRLGLGVSRRTVGRAMRRLGLTRKKSRSGPPSGTGRT